MRRILVVFSFLLVSGICIGQNSNDWVIAKYWDGSVYNGKKIAEDDGVISMRIITDDTIQIVRKYAQKVYDKNNALIFPTGKYVRTQGSFWTFSFGFNALGFLDSSDQRLSTHFDFSFGNRLSDKLNVGAGLGFAFNEAEVAGFVFNTQFLNLYGFGRYYLNQKSQRLFAFGRLGYGFAAEDNIDGIRNEHEGGLHAMLGLGLHFASRKKSRFQLKLGYYFQRANGREFFLDNIGNEIQADFDILIRRLMIKFAWEFR